MAKIFKTNQSLINSGFNQKTGQTLSLSGNTLVGSTATLKYSSDQSSVYTARSVADAAYVTGKTSVVRNIGSVGQVIYRSVNGITGATGFLYNNATSGVTVPNIYISQAPPNDTIPVDWLLTWSSGTSQVKKVSYSSAVGISFAANGLTPTGGIVCLGGALCEPTTIICGTSGCANAFCINNENSPIVIDNRCNGGIYLKSQSGLCSYYNTFCNSVGFAIDYGSAFKVYDNRIGANQKGLEYDANYSTFYTQRSLVDKSYVDAMSIGLHPKQAVQAATTASIIDRKTHV